MSRVEIINSTASELLDRISSGDLNPADCCDAFREQTARWNAEFNAFWSVADDCADWADSVAGLVDLPSSGESLSSGESPGQSARRFLPLPIGVKDGICTSDFPTTAGSAMLKRFRPAWDAEVVRRLRESGAFIIGKTSMDEFAMGSSTENPHFGPTRNPWDRTRVPGGSSGGSAAAVAAGMVPWALGSDTGGSIRQPAAFCGITGLKPTYGRISRRGLIAYASSLDQIGPMAKSVRDVALLLNVLAGHDSADSTSVPRGVPDYAVELGRSVKGLKIGWYPSLLDHCQPEVAEVIRAALARLEESGAIVCEIDLPHADVAVAAYYVIASSEASSNLSRYDGVRYTSRAEDHSSLQAMYRRTRAEFFGAEVKRRILLGTFALSSGYYDQYYVQASRIRRCVHQDYERAWEKVDLIVGPTSPRVAFRIGEMQSGADPTSMYQEDIFTVAANLAGLPAMSIPCGFVDGLPVGLQLTGRAFDEGTLLSVGHHFQLATDYHLWRPPCRRPD